MVIEAIESATRCSSCFTTEDGGFFQTDGVTSVVVESKEDSMALTERQFDGDALDATGAVTDRAQYREAAEKTRLFGRSHAQKPARRAADVVRAGLLPEQTENRSPSPGNPLMQCCGLFASVFAEQGHRARR